MIVLKYFSLQIICLTSLFSSQIMLCLNVLVWLQEHTYFEGLLLSVAVSCSQHTKRRSYPLLPARLKQPVNPMQLVQYSWRYFSVVPSNIQ